MSTAPKLTYAKIGNKSKNKIEANSTELIRHQQQHSEDLFSQMNQDNLNYIKKELKLKKNRSEHDKSRFNNQEEKEGLQEQITQRQKIYHKYKGEEEVSEREPFLEETQRKSTEEKPLNIHLDQEVEDDYTEIMENHHHNDERKQLTTSHNAQNQKAFTKIPENNKMYHSLPYEEPKKRVVSIEGYFRESVSTNLQKYRDDGNQFIEFLQDYISDLNQSKHLKSKTHEESSMDKKQSERGDKYIKESLKQSTHRKESNESDRIKDDFKKIEKLKRNSDTFGQPNSKYTVNSVSYDSAVGDLQMQLKKEKYNCIMLAKQVESLRQSLIGKDSIIKELRMQNQLLEEEINHIKVKQQIILKNKGQISYENRPNRSQKQTKRINDENLMYGFDSSSSHFILSHQRRGSVNPNINRNGYSSRENHQHHLKDDDLSQFNQTLFKQFESTNKQRERQNTPRKQNKDSIERIQNQYSNFIQQSRFNTKKGKRVQYK